MRFRFNRFLPPVAGSARLAIGLAVFGVLLQQQLLAQPNEKVIGAGSSNINPAEFGYNFTTRFLTLQRTKIRLAYQEQGQSSKILLFLHDADGNMGQWAPLIKQLSKSYRCLAFDLPAHGLSTKMPMSGGLQQWVDCIGQFLDENNLWSIAIVGQGIGADLAAQFAIQHPTRVEQLVLLSPTCILKPDAALTSDALKPFEFETMKNKNDSLIKKDLADVMAMPPANLKRFAQPRIAMQNQEGFGFYCNAVRNLAIAAYAQPLGAAAKQITQPCLVIGGEKDGQLIVAAGLQKMTSDNREYLRQVAVAFPNATVSIVNGTGRYPHIEDPISTAGEVLAFLKFSR
jgi:pimeloyl-ACP methyl ester carboxylesterase